MYGWAPSPRRGSTGASATRSRIFAPTVRRPSGARRSEPRRSVARLDVRRLGELDRRGEIILGELVGRVDAHQVRRDAELRQPILHARVLQRLLDLVVQRIDDR